MPETRKAWQTLQEKSAFDLPSQLTNSQTSRFEADKARMGDFQDDSAFASLQNRKKEDADKFFEGGEKLQDTERAYLKIDRETGSGPLRIKNQIKLGEDVYSLLYATCFHYDLIYFFDKVYEKECQNDGEVGQVFSDVNPFDGQ